MGERYRAAQFIEAIKGTGGIISSIASRVGCSWHTAKRYVKLYPTVGRAYDDECEAILDLAEVKTIGLIKEGDAMMIRYYLSTKGRHRGYVMKTEQAVEGGLTLKIVETEDWRGNDTNHNGAQDAPGPTGGISSSGEIQVVGGGATVEENDAGHEGGA